MIGNENEKTIWEHKYRKLLSAVLSDLDELKQLKAVDFKLGLETARERYARLQDELQ
jgi:hypothetical protein